MSVGRRLLLFFARVNVVLAWLVSLLIVHVPGPSSFDEPETQATVRGAWVSARDVASSAATPLSSRIPDALAPLVGLVADDKTIHFLLFFALGGWLAVERWLARGVDRRTLAILGAILILQAALGEVIQDLSGRVGEVGDFLANVIGLFSAFALVLGARAGIRALRRGTLGARSVVGAGGPELDPLADHSDRVS